MLVNQISAIAAMDSYYGVGAWSYRTAPHVGSDIGCAINQAIANMRAASSPYNQRQEIIIENTGDWLMSTPFNRTLIAGNYVHGNGGPFGTSIYYDTNADDFLPLYYTDDNHEGGRFTDFQVTLEEGHPVGKSGIILWAIDASGAPSGYVFERLRFSAKSGSSWGYSIAANGVAKNTGTKGIRRLVVRDCDFFCARLGGFWGQGVISPTIENTGFFVPASSGGDSFTLGGTVDVPSANLQARGVLCGPVSLSVLGKVGDINSIPI